MATSSRDSSPSSRRNLPKLTDLPLPTSIPKCKCGIKAKIRTSWTTKNPGRRFVNCQLNSCNFWEWVDEEMSDNLKSFVNLLVDKHSMLASELNTVRGRLAKIENERMSDGFHHGDMHDLVARNKELESLISNMNSKGCEMEQNGKLLKEKYLLIGIVIGFLFAFFFVR